MIPVGFVIILIGIIVLISGIVFQSKSSKVQAGGIVFIGPFPLIGGATSKEVFYMLLIVSVIMFVLFLTFGRNF